MSRDQRVDENWALIFASQMAIENSSSLAVVFCLVDDFLNAALRQYAFMIKGLQLVEAKLKERNIPFYLLIGKPESEIPKFCFKNNISHLITDFDPLKIKQTWQREISERVVSMVISIDAHNIVPAFQVSSKAEYGAYTIRPKINKLLPIFWNNFPELGYQKQFQHFDFIAYDWIGILSDLQVNREVAEVTWCLSGESEAKITLHNFIQDKLEDYANNRNNPLKDATSDLSGYLHFGQLSAQYIAQQVLESGITSNSTEVFLEELIVRRELADNFCLYNPDYDAFDGFPVWAKTSLNNHRSDEREFLYSQHQFEMSQTHDELWNAAQTQMVVTGKMHGYLRMYWAKKILEWTVSPEEALRIAIYLNDKYELDGRDPNGYAGCAWAIGGVHDRAWNKHPVFGMIRYMNENGCRRKFDVNTYIKKCRDLLPSS